MVKGFNPLAPFCLYMLHLHPNEIPRFRDAWLTDDGKRIIVLTRTGGGNRRDYVAENAVLTEVAGYLTDVDDGCDTTYAKWVYLVPDIFVEHTVPAAALMKELEIGEEKQGPQGFIEALDKRPRRTPTADEAERMGVHLKALAAKLENW